MFSLEEIFIETTPFSDGLKKWCKDHSDFTKALKITHPERFISLGMVIITYPPHKPNDKVIGFYSYDYSVNKPRFKQDFIVDIGKRDDYFVLYTRQKVVKNNKYIRDINEFFKTYGKDGNYLRSHWVEANDIPKEAQDRAKQAELLGKRIKKAGGFVPLSRLRLEKAGEDLAILKSNGSINPIWMKIKNAKN